MSWPAFDNFSSWCHLVLDFYKIVLMFSIRSALLANWSVRCSIVNCRHDDVERVSRTYSSCIIETWCWIFKEQGASGVHFQWFKWLLIYLSLDSYCKKWTHLEYRGCNAFSKIGEVLLPLTHMVELCVLQQRGRWFFTHTNWII